MQAIIGYVLGIVTVLLLRRAVGKPLPQKPQTSARDNEQLWRETLNFLTYDGNEQEAEHNG